MSAVDLLAPPTEAAVESGIESFVALARARYGKAVKAAYLFGSRARGDFKPFSDVDLAIVVDGSVDIPSQSVPLASDAYDVFLETGAEIQAWLFSEAEWSDPATSRSPGLVRSVKRDATPVASPA